MTKIKESDLFYPLNRYFSYLGYIVNTEVESKYGYKRADILLTRENNEDLIGIEMKTTLSFDLLEQAKYWKQFTDANYICIPKIKKDRPSITKDIINFLGIGWIEIDMNRYNKYYKEYADKPYFVFMNNRNEPDLYKLGMEFKVTPLYNNPNKFAKDGVKSVIYKEHQTWAVGGSKASDGSYVSSYKLLMKDVYDFLRTQLNTDNEGWVTSRDIWKHLEEYSSDIVRRHYKGNPSSSIGLALRKFEDGDVEKMMIKNKYYYKIMEGSTKFLDMEKLKKELGEEKFYDEYEEL